MNGIDKEKKEESIKGTISIIGGGNRIGITLVHDLLQQKLVQESKDPSVKDQLKIKIVDLDAQRAAYRIVKTPGSPLYHGIEFIQADMTNLNATQTALEGSNYVVSVLSPKSPMNWRGIINPAYHVKYANYLATSNIVKACQKENARFIYVSETGVDESNLWWKRIVGNIVYYNYFGWKLKAEQTIRASNIDYTIVRHGDLTFGKPNQQPLRIVQPPQEIWKREDSAIRTDVSRAIVACLKSKNTIGTTFSLQTTQGSESNSVSHNWNSLFSALKKDSTWKKESS